MLSIQRRSPTRANRGLPVARLTVGPRSYSNAVTAPSILLAITKKAMKAKGVISKFLKDSFSQVVPIFCTLGMVSLGQSLAVAQQSPPATATTAAATDQAPKISNAQLDSLVAPIALFPDQLLAQTLAASTYPLEMIQLQQWMDKNKNLKDKALADAVAKQPWDPSVQAMAAFLRTSSGRCQPLGES